MSRLLLAFLLLSLPAFADDATDKLAKELRAYATAELAKAPGKDGKYSTALPDYLNAQIKAANARDREAWNKVQTKADWEQFRDKRIKALRESLGTWPVAPKNMAIRVTKTIEAKDYRIDNLLYESRPGVWVDGNLYYPATAREKMPVILIAHSHHAPKEQGELQDMGVNWAKLGCLVLVIDQLGHGERRQHPFNTAKDCPEKFRVDRQDYYFRYNLNLQLSLVGDSLMGWMAWDLMRGLDVALARPGADKSRVILLGAVASGGDVAAVTAALDPRFTCVCPFNFGGPQPEDRYPLPADAETSFNYVGSGSWESTRNLRDSARDGFLPWVIVASVAPRKLIHAHEFSWDREHDPVWKRYQKVWGFYDATDNLSFTTGTGTIHINNAAASHCTNIGPIQRKGIYAALKKWYGIPVPEKESKDRHTSDELRCWTPKAIKELKPKPLHEVLGAMAETQHPESPRMRRDLFAKSEASFRVKDIPELGSPQIRSRLPIPDLCEAYSWPVAVPNSQASVVVLKPKHLKEGEKIPLVLCVSHEGIHRLLASRADGIAELVQSRIAVALLDWRGSGADRPGDGRGRTGWFASLASSGLMIGQPLTGLRVNETVSTLHGVLRDMSFADPGRILIWAESLATTNAPDDLISVPADLAQPRLAEPVAAIVASLVALRPFGNDIKAVLARGGLVSYRSVLDSPFVHVPHDALPINIFRAGDLPDVWAALAPKPLRLEGLVDGTNRRVTGDRLDKALAPVKAAYKKGGLVVKGEYSSDAEIAKWIVEQLKTGR